MSDKILCPTCEGDSVDTVSNSICPTCNGECMVDPKPPLVQSISERPGYFRGAKISKSQSAKGNGK